MWDGLPAARARSNSTCRDILSEISPDRPPVGPGRRAAAACASSCARVGGYARSDGLYPLT